MSIDIIFFVSEWRLNLNQCSIYSAWKGQFVERYDSIIRRLLLNGHSPPILGKPAIREKPNGTKNTSVVGQHTCRSNIVVIIALDTRLIILHTVDAWTPCISPMQWYWLPLPKKCNAISNCCLLSSAWFFDVLCRINGPITLSMFSTVVGATLNRSLNELTSIKLKFILGRITLFLEEIILLLLSLSSSDEEELDVSYGLNIFTRTIHKISGWN